MLLQLKALDKLTDHELAAMLKNSSETAFGFIYKQYWHKLLAIAGNRLNDAEDAEEVVQNIFLNLWKRRETFVLKVGFENYFAVAVKFEVINQLAKQAKIARHNEAFAQSFHQSNEAHINYDLKLLQQQLEDTISTLPHKCQLVFRMSRQAEYTNKKIAKELNLSEKAIEKHITSALKVLRKRFGQHLSILFLFFLNMVG